MEIPVLTDQQRLTYGYGCCLEGLPGMMGQMEKENQMTVLVRLNVSLSLIVSLYIYIN